MDTHSIRATVVALCSGLVLVLGVSPLRAQDEAPAHTTVPTAAAAVLAAPVTLDGILAEEIWSRASPATAFRQTDPHEGRPATQRTEVRFAERRG